MKAIKHSTASYLLENKSAWCDVDELAEDYAFSYGNIPERLNDTRAMEICLLARAYLADRPKKWKSRRAKYLSALRKRP